MIPIEVTRECHEAYDKARRGQLRFVAFGTTEGFKELKVEETSEDKSLSVEAIRDLLPRDQARYVYLQFGYLLEGEGKRSKTLLVKWIPGKCPLKSKMVYAAASNRIRQKMPCQVDVDARDLENFSEEHFFEKSEKFK